MPPVAPVQIAPPGFTGRGFRHTDYAGPWERGTDLYGLFSNAANVDNPPIGDAPNMYKSVDEGVTWAIVDPKVSADWTAGGEAWLAAAGHGGLSIHRNGDILYVAWNSLTMAGPIVRGRMRIATFDMATDTWTIDAAPGGPELVGDKPGPPAPPELSPAENDRYLMRVRDDGTVVVWFMGSYNLAGYGEVHMWSWTAGGGWVNRGIVATDNAASHFPVGAVLDTTDSNAIHLFNGSTPRLLFALPQVMSLYHLTIRADWTLALYQFIDNDIARGESNMAFGLADIGNSGAGIELAIPCLSDSDELPFRSKLYVFHAPVAENPVWVRDQLVFPGGATDFYLDLSPNPEGAFACSVLFFANQLNAFVVTISSPLGFDDSGTLWRATKNAAVWGAWTALYSSVANSRIVLGDPNPMPATGGLGVFVFGQDYQIAPNTEYQYYLWFAGPAPATPPAPVLGGSRRMVVLVPNRFDAALGRELEAHRRNLPKRACCEPEILWNVQRVRIPDHGIPFRKTAAIPTPLAISGDVEVLNFQVPAGYDGILAAVFHLYTGPGFLEGGGDLVWRIVVNRVYAKHLGNVLFTLGGLRMPCPLDGGVQLQSGQHVRYIVNAPNLSGGILPLASQILCGMEGLFYARS